MADFDVTAALEHIRDGAESEITHPDDECGIEAGGFCTPHGALALLKAVEAVLKLHIPITRREGWNLTCSYDNHRWPCPEVEAITAALAGTGKEGSEDG